MIKKNFKIKFTDERMISKFNLEPSFYCEHTKKLFIKNFF